MSAAVITETGSRGKLSDFVLAIVVLSDVVVLVLFSLFMQLARATFGETAPEDVNMLVRLAWEIGGAVAFGALVGALFALYLRYVGREVTLALLVVCLLLSQVGFSQRVEPLLAAMAAGIVIANVSVAQGEALKAAIQSGALPLLVVFFVAIGASLRLDTLMVAGAAATGLAAVRVGVDLDRRAHRTPRGARRGPGGTVRVDRVDLAGGHHPGPRGCARGGVPDLGYAGADAARGPDCDRRARRAGAVPHRSSDGGGDRRERAAAAAGRLESRAVSAQSSTTKGALPG